MLVFLLEEGNRAGERKREERAWALGSQLLTLNWFLSKEESESWTKTGRKSPSLMRPRLGMR